MPEPTSTAAAWVTLAGVNLAVPMVTAFGIPLGLRADVLVAGFLGSLCAMILVNTVPGNTDTWKTLLKTTLHRMAVAMASSITAGYVTPLILLAFNLQLPMQLAVACVVGACARKVLSSQIKRFSSDPPPPPANPPQGAQP
ncbi:MAG: hypothetical protein V4706_01675 [Pseudomonadota bacterium]